MSYPTEIRHLLFSWAVEEEVTSFLLLPAASYLLSAMDPTAQPCQDFFQFACGAWNRKHFIPEDRSSISTFEVLADQQQIVLKGQQRQPLVTRREYTQYVS